MSELGRLDREDGLAAAAAAAAIDMRARPSVDPIGKAASSSQSVSQSDVKKTTKEANPVEEKELTHCWPTDRLTD